MIFTCTLQVSPYGKGRPRFTKQGHAYTPAKTVAKEAEIKYWLIHEGAPKFEGPVCVKIDAFFQKPKSAPKSRVFHMTKPDLSNVAKTVEDAGNGILWDDDKQIVSMTLTKQYGDPERIELAVETA